MLESKYRIQKTGVFGFEQIQELKGSTLEQDVRDTARAQRKKSLSDRWMDGSECRYWPDRKASLWAYLHGAGTGMVPGQFQYK